MCCYNNFPLMRARCVMPTQRLPAASLRTARRLPAARVLIAFSYRRLHLGRAAQCVDDAGELDQEAIAGGLDDAAAMLGDLWVEHRDAQGLEPAEGAFLVGFDQPRIARDIGCEDRDRPRGRSDAPTPGTVPLGG